MRILVFIIFWFDVSFDVYLLIVLSVSGGMGRSNGHCEISPLSLLGDSTSDRGHL